MFDQKLTEILNHELDCGAAIVTSDGKNPHIVNTWNSFIKMAKKDSLLIPVGGMSKTEANLKANSKITLSITNREVQGNNYPGTGVIVTGIGVIQASGEHYEVTKQSYPWARAVLVVTIKNVEQTM